MSVYVLELEWYDAEKDELFENTLYRFFDSAEKALDFAKDVVFNKSSYEEHRKPTDIYMFKLNENQFYCEETGLLQRYDASWQDLRDNETFRFMI